MKRRKQSTARGGRKSTRAISEDDIKALAAAGRNVALSNERLIVGEPAAVEHIALGGGPVRPPRVFYEIAAEEGAKRRTEAPRSQESPADSKKRGAGRPPKEYILEAVKVAAYAEAQRGEYRWIASQLNVSPDQLSDWVRNHRDLFEQWVAQYKKDKLPS